MQQIKKLPYGKSDFKLLREKNFYYVDKTAFIPIIDSSASFFHFHRPRRFGKSLLVSMLETYYDIAEKDNFDRWFGGLKIHESPTPERNSYLVMHLDFSEIAAKDENDFDLDLSV